MRSKAERLTQQGLADNVSSLLAQATAVMPKKLSHCSGACCNRYF